MKENISMMLNRETVFFRWASGNVYVGKYKNDERDGQGEMIWTDGSKYIGEWKNGIQNGYGKMIFPNGVVKEGYFDNNIFKGKEKPEEIDKEEEIRLHGDKKILGLTSI